MERNECCHIEMCHVMRDERVVTGCVRALRAVGKRSQCSHATWIRMGTVEKRSQGYNAKEP